ncbi:hypothetical protein D3C86_866080 [compost metagenome]
MIINNILTRGAAALVLATTAGIVGGVYFSSSYYGGPKTDLGTGFNLLDLLVTVSLLVVVKLLIYDLIGSTILKRIKSPLGIRVFYAGYILALLIDMAMVYMSFRSIYMNLSIFGTIVYSPAILFITIIILLIQLPLSSGKNHRTNSVN